jgi:hypothetical protein
MMRTVAGDHGRFEVTYFKHYDVTPLLPTSVCDICIITSKTIVIDEPGHNGEQSQTTQPTTKQFVIKGGKEAEGCVHPPLSLT